MRSVLTGLLAAGMMLGSSPQLLAQTAAEVSGWKGITTDGYASFSYSYDANTPEPRVNQFRVFDFNDNEPQLDVAELVIQRAVSQPNQFGFRFDLLAGSGVPEVTAAYGMFRDRKTLVAHHVDIPQLYVRYVVPLGKGLSLDAGKFDTHMGYEVIGGYDGYNDNFSRGFIFGYGIPFTHTGLRATYTFTSRISAMASLTKGWDDVQSLNHGYTWGSQLNVATTKNTSVSFNFLHGPERVNDVRDQRTAGEMVATWKTTPRLSFASDGLYGHEENAVGAGSRCDLEGNCRLCEVRGDETIFVGIARGAISRWRRNADGLRPGAQRIHIYAGVCAGRETIEDRFPFKTCGWKDRAARRSADGYVESGCVSEGIERGWRAAGHGSGKLGVSVLAQ
jgi:hypothetical protein